MVKLQTYPHWVINVNDSSIAEPVVDRWLPLHRPMYMIKAQKGELNKLGYYPLFTDAEKEFGAGTFDELNDKYYSKAAYFLKKSYPYNGAFIMRVAGDTAKEAICILEARVSDADIPQYEKDTLGNYITELVQDENGHYSYVPQPLLNDADEQITLPGIKIEWVKRYGLLDSEVQNGVDEDNLHKLQPRTDASTGATVYPIMAFKTTNPGAWGNDVGFEFFYDSDFNGIDLAYRQGGVAYGFRSVSIDRHTNNASNLMNKYGGVTSAFVMKDGAVDTATYVPVSMNAVLEDAYDDAHKLPYSIVCFNDTFKVIGERFLAKLEETAAIDIDSISNDTDKLIYTKLKNYASTMRHTLKDGYYVNIASGRDLENKPYDTLKVFEYDEDPAGDIFDNAPVKENINHYLQNGLDGDIGHVAIETKMREILNGLAFQELLDKLRYPITHIFDAGYSIDTKFAMLNFLNIRDDVKAVVGTHIDIGRIRYNALNAYTVNNDTYKAGLKTISVVPSDGVDLNDIVPGMHVFGPGILEGTIILSTDSTTIHHDAVGVQGQAGYIAAYDEITGMTLTLNKEVYETPVPNAEGNIFLAIGAGAITKVNTQQQDVSMVSTLTTRARMSRESIVKGTVACRATVFSQAGIPHDNPDWTSCVLWAAVKKAEYQNIDYLDREPSGRPNNEVDLFKKINWVPAGPTSKINIWDGGGNYMQYCNMTDMHYPSVRSVYEYASSVLVDDFFVDAIVYTKHLIANRWTVFTGLRLPFPQLSQMIEDDLTKKISALYNGKFGIQVTVYETELDAIMGDRLSINCTITSPGTRRVWDVTLDVRRGSFAIGGE